MVFQAVVELVADELIDLPGDERVGFVFDRRRDLEGRAKPMYDSLRDNPDFRQRHRLGAIAFDDRIRVKPLQAADVLAYEAYRRMEDLREGRPKRWQWERLQRSVIESPIIGRDNLLALIEMHRSR